MFLLVIRERDKNYYTFFMCNMNIITNLIIIFIIYFIIISTFIVIFCVYSRVSEVDENTVLQSQAYLLFYERIL